ncbi:MAG: glutamate synthase, partial [Lysobacterales bacterium]
MRRSTARAIRNSRCRWAEVGVYDINRILMPESPPEYQDDTADGHYVPAPCQVACPVGTDAPSYLAYIWEGKYEEAFEAITATNPFSSICGRVCDAPCEPACRREAADGAVQIRNLKRFVMDRVGNQYDPPAIAANKAQSVGIVGAGPAGLVAAHDLCMAGYHVDVYEMTGRSGGMMVWGIPAFRLPPGIIEEDIQRLEQRCPDLTMHFNTALGRDVSLDDLKKRHDAVLLTIGAWWGKNMRIPGEEHDQVVDGVGFLRRVNAGARPELPETVIVIGGGDVAMDACRVAKRLPGCKHVKVVYRRGPEDIPARRIELEGAIKEGIEFIYNTQQVSVDAGGNQLKLRFVRTESGEPDEDGRRRPKVVPGSEHDIDCGMVIAAVGQQTECDELDARGMMASDRVRASFDSMRTLDEKVFAAGDGAFGGSTIVMAMSHGQRAAYYVKAFLEGRRDPMPYRTPFRTRRVPVAQDLSWETLPEQEAEFFGLGEKPIEFPEIESTYDEQTARKEAARCYRCDAETGSADYSVHHREDLFSMARTNIVDQAKHKAMLNRRLRLRENPFPEGRAPSLDDLVFLPANLSRLVIDPYREACKISTDLAGKLPLELPYLATGFDEAPEEIRQAVAKGLSALGCSYVGRRPVGDSVPWLQLVVAGGPEPSADAAALVHVQKTKFQPPPDKRLHAAQLLGIAVSSTALLEQCIVHGLEHGFDIILLDATNGIEGNWPELGEAPSPRILRDAITILRSLNREEEIDLLY